MCKYVHQARCRIYDKSIYVLNFSIPQISAVSADNSNGTEWRQERLQTPAVDQNSVVPMATEVNPSLYEELKLGQEGVGFKRLVS